MRRSTADPVRKRLHLLLVLTICYVTLTILVACRTPVLDLDQTVHDLHPAQGLGPLRRWLLIYVKLGQRAPSTWAALPWFVLNSWRKRSLRPLCLLGVGLLTLNGLVGVTKVVVGRVGPLDTNSASRLFAGGDIYPSGHVANCVMLYGLITILVTPRLRRFWTALAGFIAISVGIAGVWLNMHWPTDIVGGWLIGGIVIVFVASVEDLARSTALGARMFRMCTRFRFADDTSLDQGPPNRKLARRGSG